MTLVKDMKWSNVKTYFMAKFYEQWQVDNEQTFLNQIEPYNNHIQDTNITVLSTYNPNTPTANRKAAAKNKLKTFVAKDTTKKVEHRDSNKGQKYKVK